MPGHRRSATTRASQPYDYDPEKAKSLLKEAGAEGMTLNVRLPDRGLAGRTCRTRRRSTTALRSDLEAVGIKVNVVTKPWNGGYLDSVDNGQFDAWLLGWTGDYNAPDNFIGTFFGASTTNDFNTKATSYGKTLSEDLARPTRIVDEAAAQRGLREAQPADHGGVPPRPADLRTPRRRWSSAARCRALVASPLTAETSRRSRCGGK